MGSTHFWTTSSMTLGSRSDRYAPARNRAGLVLTSIRYTCRHGLRMEHHLEMHCPSGACWYLSIKNGLDAKQWLKERKAFRKT